jgi:hypothetical protein
MFSLGSLTAPVNKTVRQWNHSTSGIAAQSTVPHSSLDITHHRGRHMKKFDMFIETHTATKPAVRMYRHGNFIEIELTLFTRTLLLSIAR